jgi:hypothetical protein
VYEAGGVCTLYLDGDVHLAARSEDVGLGFHADAGDLGAAAGITFFQDPKNAVSAGPLAIVTRLVPAIRDPRRLDIHVDQIKSLAAEFKALRDGFRQIGRITVDESVAEAHRRLDALMEQLGRARSSSVTIPERIFKKAQGSNSGLNARYM